jgi:hypothetical protein
MKYIIVLLLVVLFTSCNEAKYRKGEEICAYNTKLSIISIHTFSGTGGGLKGVNYTCKYVDKHGVIREITIYEKEIVPCRKLEVLSNIKI